MAKRLPKDIVCVFYLLYEKSERLLRDADFLRFASQSVLNNRIY